ncbi:unnamed protein product [Blepharisma stoltei]|uniref:Methionine synthase reductase n=1 Tax=Blepharisma stoltei TaxID=1481888 RepID=A0AAU9JNJ9_9CILI|nr:unnamed protein product [Blepharisma stoltei]
MAAKILWASQTGNCEEISRIIYEESAEKRIPCERYCLQELGTTFNISQKDVIVIVVSSTGDGELPDNGLKFYRWIKQQEGTIFSHVKYTLLGLGDSNYSTFQGGPNIIEHHMKKLGATEFYERGVVDEQLGIEQTVDAWIDGLWEPLKKQVEELSKAGSGEQVSQAIEDMPSIWGRILEYRVLTEENATKKVIEIRITTEGKSYIPGTALFMYPQNPDEKVTEMITKLGLEATQSIIDKSHISKSVSHRFQTPISIFDFFKRFVDFQSAIKTRCAIFLASILYNPTEKEGLTHHIDQSKITMPDEFTFENIINKYHSWDIQSLDSLLDVIPILSPRNYSISSSPTTSPGSITIAFSVMGLCTRYLEHAALNDLSVEYSLQNEPGVFWEGIKASPRPIMICTGTGISPFRGILEHLVLNDPKPVWVIYGCRNSTKNTPQKNFDHVYQDDINGAIRVLGGKLSVANSRSGNGPKYIQDIIKNEAREIVEWGSAAILCGNFDSKDIKAKLQTINENFEVFSEIWE